MVNENYNLKKIPDNNPPDDWSGVIVDWSGIKGVLSAPAIKGHRPIKAITVCEGSLVAVCEDGTVWMMKNPLFEDSEWMQVKPILVEEKSDDEKS